MTRALAFALGLLAVAFVPDAAAETVLYANPGVDPSVWYDGQAGVEAIDDLHLGVAGDLSRIRFEYFEPGASTLDAEVTVYGNPGGLDTSRPVLVGPLLVEGLAPGLGVGSVDLPEAITLTSACWVGIRFSSATAGLLVNGTPTIGTSHDYYVENDRFLFFDGSPEANFAIELVEVPTSTAAVPVPRDRPGLRGATPNPFNPRTTVAYWIPREAVVTLTVHDVSGRHVATLVDGVRASGDHTIVWDGTDTSGRPVASGVYLQRLRVEGFTDTGRMVLVR